MVGYRKWSKDQHSKGPLDGKHGAVFRNLVMTITGAIRVGNRYPLGHPQRQSAVKMANTPGGPQKNIERAELQNYFTQPESTAIAAVEETIARRSQADEARAAADDLQNVYTFATLPEETLSRCFV